MRDDVQNYVDANPQVQADLEGMRQPLTDTGSVASGLRYLGRMAGLPE